VPGHGSGYEGIGEQFLAYQPAAYQSIAFQTQLEAANRATGRCAEAAPEGGASQTPEEQQTTGCERERDNEPARLRSRE